MISIGQGNLLHADVDALVNTVNTVGVMGKGIALQFKRAYPSMFAAYETAANKRELRLGVMHVYETGQMNPRFVVNFPTKGHWRAGSKLRDIEAGLDDLIRVVRELGITSIAVPPLGCGNGGLNWADVEPLIRAAFAAVPDVNVVLYPPAGAPAAVAMPANGPRPAMTPGRAALIALLHAYSVQAEGSASLIESQKLMYFLQIAGEPLRLKYEKNRYGPYADNLRQVLKVVEGHYLQGFGDGSRPVRQAEPLDVLPDAPAAAQEFLDQHPQTGYRINRVLELADGYETPYGLELLASVHWLVNEDPDAGGDVGHLVCEIRAWTPRKGRMFTDNHVRSALENLQAKGWIPSRA